MEVEEGCKFESDMNMRADWLKCDCDTEVSELGMVADRCSRDEWCFFCRGETHFSNLLMPSPCYTLQKSTIYRCFIPPKATEY